jgi:hypothetical protein
VKIACELNETDIGLEACLFGRASSQARRGLACDRGYPERSGLWLKWRRTRSALRIPEQLFRTFQKMKTKTDPQGGEARMTQRSGCQANT